MVEHSRRWLNPALRAQSAVAAVATASFCVLALVGVELDLSLQMFVLLAGIVVVGFPHGAFDHLVAEPVLSDCWGRMWWVFFLTGYLGLTGLVWLAWTLTPAITLAGFLAATVLHFGVGDIEDRPTQASVPRWLDALTYGSLPVLMPIALHPGEAAPVLAAMADVAPPVMQRVLSSTVWLLPFWVAAFTWAEVFGWRQGGGVAGRLITAAGFVLLPPLLAFGLYFSLGHSAKHLLRVMAWHDAANAWRAAGWAARVVVPAAAVCAAGLAGLTLLGYDTSVDILAQSFRVIAALTLPHMIVTAWLDRPSRSAVPRAEAAAGTMPSLIGHL